MIRNGAFFILNNSDLIDPILGVCLFWINYYLINLYERLVQTQDAVILNELLTL